MVRIFVTFVPYSCIGVGFFMKFIADFHIHSKFSRATSKEMDLENIEKWARIKGVKVVGTGDFTHPLWFKEITGKLEEAEPGLFKLRNAKKELAKLKNGFEFNGRVGLQNGDDDVRYILTSEISCIYSRHNATRKVHLVIFAPSVEVVEKINTHLGWIGNLKADGRPILGLDAKELTKIVLNISSRCLVVPAHAWTPHFSVFGSQSGFDSLKECFDEFTDQIYAIETGLSSDPAMNWRWSELDHLTLISNSDSHSPAKIGREANVFEGSRLDYMAIVEAIKRGAKEKRTSLKLAETIEFFPEEGKYHLDGHRNCKKVMTPEETAKNKRKCPICGRPVTVGVLNRVSKLANRPEGGRPERVIPYRRLVQLEEIIADALEVGVNTKKVRGEYKDLINRFGNEFNILLEASIKEIEAASLPEIAEGVRRVRDGQVKIEPGYDGEYGKIKIFDEKESANFNKQKSLF